MSQLPQSEPSHPAPRGGLLRRPLALAAARLAWLWRRRPSPHRTAGVLSVALLAGLGLLGLGFPLVLPHLLPGVDDWRAAGALLARDARPGDVAVVSPAWAERLRAFAPARLPVLAYPRYAGEDLDGVRRIWLVSLPGAPGFTWDPEVDLLDRAARVDAPLPLGGLELSRLDVSYPESPLAFLPDRLASALVTRAGAPCLPQAPGHHRCPEGGLASRTVAEVGGLPRPCLSLRGVGPAPIAVAFASVPVGRLLRGRAAVEGGTPVQVAVRVDGEAAGTVELAPGGWRPFRLDTGRWAGQGHAVVLEARAAAPTALCLEAVTLP